MAFFLNRRNPDAKKLGIYVHIPFCKSRCEYCDFYSNGGAKEPRLVDDYMQALSDHMREAGKLAPDHVVDTIYFGGGTPSYFGAENLDKILDEVHRSFHLDVNPEITLEANPDSLNEKSLKRLLKAGFNRLSMGVQSDNDEVLAKLGRPHTFGQAKAAMEMARKVGFANISLDLMYGLPDQTLDDWLLTVENIAAMRPEHISCYLLKIEEGTPMWSYKDRLNIPNDDQQYRMYMMSSQYLRERGYEHYEISNFGKKGFASRHNLKYWTGQEYISFGPSAASEFDGKRYTIMSDVKGYIEGIAKHGQILSECESIPPRSRAADYLIFRPRTNQGIDPKEFERKFLLSFKLMEKYLQHCANNDCAELIDGRWVLTEKGWFISNHIIVELLKALDESESIVRY